MAALGLSHHCGPDAWALGDSKRPGAEPLRFTTAELNAAGIDPSRFTVSA